MSLKRELPALKNFKFLIFALLDPDPADQKWMRIRIHNSGLFVLC